MPYDPACHNRRSLRLRDYDYSQPGAYFVTLCIQNRYPLFGTVIDEHMRLNAYGRIARDVWLSLPGRYPGTSLDAFVIMPDHMHGLLWAIHESPNPESPNPESPISPRREPSSNPKRRRQMLLPKMIGYYKMNVSKRINLLRGTPGARVWQRSYWDRIVRNERALAYIRRYIHNNPARWNRP